MWDGPRSLHDMLVPGAKEISGLVPDYPLNMVEIRTSDNMMFHNSDVDQVFSLVRKIYRKEITAGEFCSVRRDLAEMVGTIVQSEKIIKLASRSKKEEINMCRALDEMMQERENKGKIDGKIEGKIEGKLEGKIEAYFDMGMTPESIAGKMKVDVEKVNKVIGMNC